MAKFSSVFVCQQCGFKSSQFLGRCPQCDSWNSFVEEVEEGQRSQKSQRGQRLEKAEVINLASLKKTDYKRLDTGFEEFNRCLGGGVVLGSLVLVSGDPGIGKSTLLTQLALNINQLSVPGDQFSDTDQQTTGQLNSDNRKQKTDNRVLYIAGEESAQQIKIRVDRIKPNAQLSVLNEVDVDVICETINQLSVPGNQFSDEGLSVVSPSVSKTGKQKTGKPESDNRKQKTDNRVSLVIVDSIQTLQTQDLASVAGSVGQVRECTLRLQRIAKALHIPIFIVGHVTKEGNIAGPKTLEHMVDVVLSLEGDPASLFRILRSTKNRFGPTDEVGVFEMEESGMIEVKNPSRMFLEQRVNAPGSAVTSILTGMRPILVEIQALVTKSNLPIPRRTGSGVDNNRLQLLVAVLQKRLGLSLFDHDIFVNVTGGLKVFEPAADLAICLAIVSSFKDQSIKDKTALVGEVGLLGEVRIVRGIDKRTNEAKKLGYINVISPENAGNLSQAVRLVFVDK